jgi:hypothetical protein
MVELCSSPSSATILVLYENTSSVGPKPGLHTGRVDLTLPSSIQGGCSNDEEVPESGSRARLNKPRAAWSSVI